MARGPFVTDEEIIKWTQQFADGVSISQIAKESNRTYNTVKRFIKKVSVQMAANDEPQAPNAA
jgi:DNA-binding NarL/FixJ family response regulator